MPIYEYENDQDGEVISLLRPMAQADAPVDDPEGRGRTFRRRHSVFGVSTGASAESGGASEAPQGGCCPCGVSTSCCSHRN